jgi:hypothetical protein
MQPLFLAGQPPQGSWTALEPLADSRIRCSAFGRGLLEISPVTPPRFLLPRYNEMDGK